MEDNTRKRRRRVNVVEPIFYDEFGQEITKEEHDAEEAKKPEREAAERVHVKMRTEFQDLVSDKRLGYSFATSVKDNLKVVDTATGVAKYFGTQISHVEHDLRKLNYAEDTDDFSIFTKGNINRSNTEEARYKLDSAIIYLQNKIDIAWSKVNAAKNTLFIFYFLLSDTNSIVALHEIYKLFKEGLETSHYAINSKNGKTHVRYFKKELSEITGLLKRGVIALERMADKVDAVAEERIDEMLENDRQEDLEETTTYWYSRTTPKSDEQSENIQW